MEETLGKRIAACRKQLGITQDRLAEQLGVTAQAVSKWENDQSCPDITMLPKLAEIFGTTTDALLGLAPSVHPETSESVTAVEETTPGHRWELCWDAGHKNSIGFAIWMILTAGWLFAANYYHIDADFWDLLWTNGLIVFGFLGLLPKFSFISLGCMLFGIHSLLEELDALPGYLGKELLLPVFLLLFGLSLLMKALRNPRKSHFSVIHNGKTVSNSVSGCNTGADTFNISCAFNEKTHRITLPRLRRGDVNVSFGHVSLDLTAVGNFAPDCQIDASCSFGELNILVPKHIRAEVNADSSFGSVDISGCHNPETDATIHVNAGSSFGQIIVQYI